MDQESVVTTDKDPPRDDSGQENPDIVPDKVSTESLEDKEKDDLVPLSVGDKIDNVDNVNKVEKVDNVDKVDHVDKDTSPECSEVAEATKSQEDEKKDESSVSCEDEKEKIPSLAAPADPNSLSSDKDISQICDDDVSKEESGSDRKDSKDPGEGVDVEKKEEETSEKSNEIPLDKPVVEPASNEILSDEPPAEATSEEKVDEPSDDLTIKEISLNEPVESTSKEPEETPGDNKTVESSCAKESAWEKSVPEERSSIVGSEKFAEEEGRAKEDETELSSSEETARPKPADPENIVEILDPSESPSKKCVEDSKSDSESVSNEADSTSKETPMEKQIGEPENTEFVQISQDKQDDGANENQTIEAEDPFGGDNLTADNVEQGDVDSPAMVNMDFHKLGDQADNLQDVVNAKDQESVEFAAEDSNLDDTLETNNPEADSSETNVEIVARKTSESNVEIEAPKMALGAEKSGTDVESADKSSEDKSGDEPMLVDNLSEGQEEDELKKKEQSQAMESEDSQSNVLPGQDDELCIIPDSMKETTSSRSDSAKDGEKDSTDVTIEKSSENENKEVEAENEATQSKDLEIVAESDEPMAVDDDQPASTHGKERKQDDKATSEKKSSTCTTTADVIDVDDEIKSSEIDEMTIGDDVCKQCSEKKPCNINVKVGSDTYTVCSQACKEAFTGENNKSMDIPSDAVNSKREKRCASCLLIVETGDERNLSWETMEFCNEECLGKFQTKYGSYCRNCNGSVQPISLGKYCVRFGYDVRQFCCSSCLEEFKKGLKVCSYCQKDISSGIEGFLAPVGDKGQFKDFCTQYCMEKYSRMNSNDPPATEKKSCSVCQEVKVVHCEVQIDRASPVAICGDPCFAAFKFVNKVDPEQCSTCKKFFELVNKKSFVVFYESEAHTFCSKTCLNIFIITNRKIVPCNWCKVKKYNFDMIRKDLKTGQALMMCSLNCLTLYQVSVNAVSAKRISCDFCKEFSQAQYHLTMSDATVRNFCSYNCVMKFQGQYTKSPITIPSGDDPVPTGMPKRTYPPAKGSVQTVQKPNDIASKKAMPVISSVTSLASLTSNGQVTQAPLQQTALNNVNVPANVVTTQTQSPQVIVNQQVITRPPSPVKIHNKVTQCKPLTHTKGVSVRPHPCHKSTQTEGDARILIPIPVPIYVPFPVQMWNMPFPVPVPFPLPIPVPIFIPTTRNSAKGILKDIKRIQEKIPADPFEAELLRMAEMVATEKKATETDSDSSDDNGRDASTEAVDSSNTFGEDMLQMALKMATGELDEPAVDLETALTPNTITATQATSQSDSTMSTDVQPERNVTASNRGKKRMVPYKPRGAPSKRGRRISGVHDVPMMPPPESQPPAQPRMMEPIEKPDANMALKYTFGVNAWRQWVIAKNAELEKQVTPTRKVKLFKTDLLQLTADELNYTLCLFVKEVRKPNGAEYAPDTIYYLCLGIQQYLFENNRIDNIFTDSYYEKFTDCLNDVAKKFSVLYNDAQYIVTRVEEEHLWECKQLGAHSPHVLLSTLMFFNTKHFNLVTVEEHMQLSFSHIMKHWKRNPAAQAATAVAGKGPGTRNVLLRFYPPQSALEANSRKKKVYEQQENEENPLRCPVKLYEFYLSKCPESVKTRNDVFYLLPERSCVPDSPVWYSTSALAKEHLIKMLYRVKMVKEINVALLTS